MATLRNKRKLAAVTRETLEEHPRNGQSRDTSVPRINEEYITQVSEEVEGRVTKKLSQQFNRTESRILGALSKLDEFLLNPQIRTHSATVPGTFRNTNVENQGTNEDDSQSDPHPEAGIFRGQTTQNSGPIVTVVTLCYCSATTNRISESGSLCKALITKSSTLKTHGQPQFSAWNMRLQYMVLGKLRMEEDLACSYSAFLPERTCRVAEKSALHRNSESL